MRICPNADHSDGLLDITMVKSASRIKLIRLFPTVFKGTHVDLDEVTTDRARTILVESPGINAYADGDYVCPCPPRFQRCRVRSQSWFPSPRADAHAPTRRARGRLRLLARGTQPVDDGEGGIGVVE